jgi:hypothetical protein
MLGSSSQRRSDREVTANGALPSETMSKRFGVQGRCLRRCGVKLRPLAGLGVSSTFSLMDLAPRSRARICFSTSLKRENSSRSAGVKERRRKMCQVSSSKLTDLLRRLTSKARHSRKVGKEILENASHDFPGLQSRGLKPKFRKRARIWFRMTGPAGSRKSLGGLAESGTSWPEPVGI